MKFFTILFFSFFLISVTVRAEIKAELGLSSSSQVYKEGDLVEGTLKIWPVENADLEQFKKLENTGLGSSLLIAEVESAGVSPNNADVVELKLLFIVRPQKEASSSINYNGQSVVVNLPQVQVQEIKKEKDFIVLDQGAFNSPFIFILISAGVLALILLAVWQRKRIVGLFSKDPKAMMIKKFDRLFQEAQLRSDFEKVYALKKEWLPLLKIKGLAHEEFFKIMEEHQYKKEWGEKEISEVRKSFDFIRGSFK